MDSTQILLGSFGATEIVVIVILVILLFGGKKIPELMKGLGTGLKEFKRATQNEPEQKAKTNPNKEIQG
ncbi:MAG: twin-arginine translocase TatA/TatE family subunit [Flavobacteriales bacterium Tduv]